MPDTTQTSRVTLKDVAREAKMSVAAVSKALSGHPHVSDDTRRRAIRVSNRLNYKPRGQRASAVATSKQVGLLLFEVDRYARYAIDWLASLTEAGDRNGLRMELIPRPEGDDAESWIASLNDRLHLAGLMVFGFLHRELLLAIRHPAKPLVAVGELAPETIGELPAHLVTCDAVGMGQTAAEMLIAAGHRRIGFFCSQTIGGDWNDRWLTGYRAAIHRAGLVDDLVIRPSVEECRRDEVGAEVAGRFAAMPEPPTAYVTPTVRAAARFLDTMASLGRSVSPDRIVMGGREQERREYQLESVGLVAEPMSDMAERAAVLLAGLIDHRTTLTPAKVVFPPRILERSPATVGPVDRSSEHALEIEK